MAAVLAIGLWIVSAAANLDTITFREHEAQVYSASLRARQQTATGSIVIAGSRLPAGTVVTRSDEGQASDVVAVDLPEPAVIQGVPVVGHVPLSDGKLDGNVTLARDARVGDAYCSAHEVTRFESGRIVTCRLAEPSRIGGIPCSGSIDLQVGVVCTLAADYARFGVVWRPQTKLTDFGSLVWFRTGPLHPNLYVLGAPLGADSEVQFNRGRIASVDLRSNPTRFRGCAIELIMIDSGAVTGQTSGACDLPRVPPGNVALLAATVGVRAPASR